MNDERAWFARIGGWLVFAGGATFIIASCTESQRITAAGSDDTCFDSKECEYRSSVSVIRVVAITALIIGLVLLLLYGVKLFREIRENRHNRRAWPP